MRIQCALEWKERVDDGPSDNGDDSEDALLDRRQAGSTLGVTYDRAKDEYVVRGDDGDNGGEGADDRTGYDVHDSGDAGINRREVGISLVDVVEEVEDEPQRRVTKSQMSKWERVLEEMVEKDEDYSVVDRTYYKEKEELDGNIRERRIRKASAVGKVEEDRAESEEVRETVRHAVEISQLIRAREKAKSEGWSVSQEVSSFDGDEMVISAGITSYQDVLKQDPFIADNVMEQRGRVNPPVYYIRMYPDLWMGDGRRVAGVDVARYGDDRTVIAVRYGMHVVDIQAYAKQGTVDTVGRIVSCIKEWDLDEVVIDVTGGLGAAVVDMLRKNEIDEICAITCVHFNDEPRSNRLNAFNARAEMYLLFGEKSGNGEVSLPSDEELLEEFVAIDYEYSMAGDGDKLKLYPKDKTRKALGRSPDKSDAVVLSFYDRPGLMVY